MSDQQMLSGEKLVQQFTERLVGIEISEADQRGRDISDVGLSITNYRLILAFRSGSEVRIEKYRSHEILKYFSLTAPQIIVSSLMIILSRDLLTNNFPKFRFKWN
jgi:hypothetical protein